MPSLAALASRAGLSPHHFHRVFKAVTGLTPQGLRRGAPRRARARRAAGGGDGDRGDLRRRLQLQRPLLRDVRRGAGHDADATTAPAAPNTEIRFAVGECSLGSILVAQSAKGVCAILLGDDPDALVRDLQDRFPRAQLIGGDAALRAARGQGGRASSRRRRSASTCRSTCAARRSSSASGRRFARSRPAQPRATPRSPRGSVARRRCGRWRRPAPRTRWRWRFPAIASCAHDGACPAIAGASSASARCSSGRRTHDARQRRPQEYRRRASRPHRRSTGTRLEPISTRTAGRCSSGC